MSIPATAVMTAVLGLLLVGLATRVSLLRIRLKIGLGDGGNPVMLKAVRVHANNAEHIPIFLLLALAYELVAGTTGALVAVGALFVLARLFYSAGLMLSGWFILRQGGALATSVAQVALAVMLLVAVAG